MNNSAFEIFHPLVGFTTFVAIIVCVMSAFHPLYLTISLIMGITYSTYLFGFRQVMRSLLWQIPFVCVIAVINPFFSASGSTALMYIGIRAIYLESLIYGACMGVLLVSSLLWFKCAARVIDLDKIMFLFSRFLPSVSIMLSMTMRLVPEFLRRGKSIDNTLSACTSANTDLNHAKKSKLQSTFRNITVLMSWSMEDSIAAADAMKISGWGKARKRTSYQLNRFRKRDATALALIMTIALVSLSIIIIEVAQFKFYPLMSQLNISVSIVAFVALLAIPLIMECINVCLWS